MIKRVNVNGFNIFPFESRSDFLEYLKAGHWHNILVALNAEKIIKPHQSLRKLVNCNIGYPDGVGAVYALRRKGIKAHKIPGADFWLDIVQEFYNEKSFYLIGAKPEVIEKTVQKLKGQFQGIQIAGYHDGFFGEDEFKKILANIKRTKPDVVFVAMGSPKQEFLMKSMKTSHPALYMGLGGSFDVYTGNVTRAPEFWIKNHLEWAYRLIKQPKRIFRQVFLFKFIYLLVRNKL